MEAASIPRARRRRRPQPSAKAQWAALAYGIACALALVLATDSWRAGLTGSAGAEGAAGITAPAAEALALDTVAARTARSVLPIGKRIGFVAWTYRGASLLLTVGGARGDVLQVMKGGRAHDGEVIRADPATGLALVRVDAVLGRPLWEQRRPVSVGRGDWLVAVGNADARHLEATSPRYAAIAVRGELAGVAGAPVLNESGRLIGIASPSGVIPIGRACGTIRRCG